MPTPAWAQRPSPHTHTSSEDPSQVGIPASQHPYAHLSLLDRQWCLGSHMAGVADGQCQGHLTRPSLGPESRTPAHLALHSLAQSSSCWEWTVLGRELLGPVPAPRKQAQRG